MRTQIHSIIQREYEKKRSRANDLVESRKIKLYENFPQIKEIDSGLNSLSLKYNREILIGGSKSSLEEIQNKIEALRLEKNNIITSNGFDSNFLEAQYSCRHCKDTGFVEQTSGSYEKCSCYRQQIIDYAYTKSNLNYLEKQNFTKFDEFLFSDVQDENKYKTSLSPRQNILGFRKKCMQFIENFKNENYKGIVFTGPTGVGKTFFSNCIAKELLDRGYTVLYLSAPQLFQMIKNYRTASWDNQETEDSNYSYIMDVDLLIIDDLGIEALTESKHTDFLSIINTRALNDSKKTCKTLISSNLSIMQIKKNYDERVASRIIGDFLIFKFIGEDLRMNKQRLN